MASCWSMGSGKTGVSGVANVSTASDANQFDTRKASLAEYFNVVTRGISAQPVVLGFPPALNLRQLRKIETCTRLLS